MSTRRIVKLWLNESTCMSHGACFLSGSHAVVETEIDSPKSHLPTIVPNAADYFDSERRQIVQAVMNCPVAALLVQFNDGRVVSSDDYDPAKGIANWCED